ncbi:unnamed protein product [Lymnaea stagnalis]|uniref:Uncharacterized protein n=1 Tax=Lymnaea stagnalis TaxID=6523 RepID=A0AAV2HVS1_LYMST
MANTNKLMGATRIASFWKRSVLCNLPVTNFRVSETPYLNAKLTLPGLNLESLDFDGNPKVTSLLSLCNTARLSTLQRPYGESSFQDMLSVTQDKMCFVTSTSVRLSKRLYDFRVPKWTLDAEIALSFVGNTSVANTVSFFLPGESNEPLWKHVFQIVTVDKNTRKPLALPDWFKAKYAGKGCDAKGLIIKPFQKPTKTICEQIQVVSSDTDLNHHTSYIAYIGYALDALHATVYRSKENDEKKTNGVLLHSIDEDVISNGLQYVEVVYLNESLLGQSLDVHLWQVENDKNILFSIERDGVPLCQLKLNYFADRLHDKPIYVFV